MKILASYLKGTFLRHYGMLGLYSAIILNNTKDQIECFDVLINIIQSSDSFSIVFRSHIYQTFSKKLNENQLHLNMHENVLPETHYFTDTSETCEKMCKTEIKV